MNFEGREGRGEGKEILGKVGKTKERGEKRRKDSLRIIRITFLIVSICVIVLCQFITESIKSNVILVSWMLLLMVPGILIPFSSYTRNILS